MRTHERDREPGQRWVKTPAKLQKNPTATRLRCVRCSTPPRTAPCSCACPRSLQGNLDTGDKPLVVIGGGALLMIPEPRRRIDDLEQQGDRRGGRCDRGRRGDAEGPRRRRRRRLPERDREPHLRSGPRVDRRGRRQNAAQRGAAAAPLVSALVERSRTPRGDRHSRGRVGPPHDRQSEGLVHPRAGEQDRRCRPRQPRRRTSKPGSTPPARPNATAGATAASAPSRSAPTGPSAYNFWYTMEGRVPGLGQPVQADGTRRRRGRRGGRRARTARGRGRWKRRNTRGRTDARRQYRRARPRHGCHQRVRQRRSRGRRGGRLGIRRDEEARGLGNRRRRRRRLLPRKRRVRRV